MSQAILNHVTQSLLRKVPDIRAGQTVKVFQKIKEGEKERTQIFEGLIIKISSGHNISKTFTVRKLVDGIGVEKIFPLHSPIIAKIQIMKVGKVRSAKLYYMRDLSGKSARLRETMFESTPEGKEVQAAEEVEEKEEVEEVVEEPKEEIVAEVASEEVAEPANEEPKEEKAAE